jgi:hypothetical protein
MSAWEAACRENLAAARLHVMVEPDRLNRQAVRIWRRRLWWARFGVYVSAGLGTVWGASIAYLIVWGIS